VSELIGWSKGDASEHYFPDILSENFKPYYHQELAFKRLVSIEKMPIPVMIKMKEPMTKPFSDTPRLLKFSKL